MKRFTHWTSAVSARVKLRRLLGYPSKLKKVVGDPRARVGTFYESLREVAGRYPPADNLTPYEYRVFSQNGEDGVIAEIVRRIGGAFPRTFVEFGGGNGLAGNTLVLADVLGWKGMFIEPAEHDHARLTAKHRTSDRVQVIRSFVSPDNINHLLTQGLGSEEIGVMSIDVDGNDYYIWEAIARKAVLVVIEYNGELPLDQPLVQPLLSRPWDGTNYYGASLRALESLGARLGYRLVHTELTGTNAFFVREDLAGPFKEIVAPRRPTNHELLGLTHPPRAVRPGEYIDPEDPRQRPR